MTVAQLIEKLKEMPQELEVMFEDDDRFYFLGDDVRLEERPSGPSVVVI